MLRSPLLRLSPEDSKATNRPPAEIAADSAVLLAPFIGAVPLAREIRLVVFVAVSRTKTSEKLSLSSALRFFAKDSNAT